MKSREGQAVALDVIRGLLKMGCPPVFILAERRFCAAGKAVDVFLDDATNPDAAALPLWGRSNRLDLWERVADLPDENLEPFARAYKNPTREALDTALTALVDGLCAAGDSDLAPVMETARNHLDRIVGYEDLSQFGAGLGHPLWAALNIPVFFHVAKRADFAVARFAEAPLRVVHDPVNKLEQAYRLTVSRGSLLSDAPKVVADPFGHAHFLGVRPGTRLEFADSVGSLGVQAADVLVSSLARISRVSALARPWTDGLVRIAMNLLPPLIEEQPMMVGAMASQKALGALLVNMIREGESRGIEPG